MDECVHMYDIVGLQPKEAKAKWGRSQYDTEDECDKRRVYAQPIEATRLKPSVYQQPQVSVLSSCSGVSRQPSSADDRDSNQVSTNTTEYQELKNSLRKMKRCIFAITVLLILLIAFASITLCAFCLTILLRSAELTSNINITMTELGQLTEQTQSNYAQIQAGIELINDQLYKNQNALSMAQRDISLVESQLSAAKTDATSVSSQLRTNISSLNNQLTTTQRDITNHLKVVRGDITRVNGNIETINSRLSYPQNLYQNCYQDTTTCTVHSTQGSTIPSCTTSSLSYNTSVRLYPCILCMIIHIIYSTMHPWPELLHSGYKV